MADRDFRRCPDCSGIQRRVEALDRFTLVTVGWKCTDCSRWDHPDTTAAA